MFNSEKLFCKYSNQRAVIWQSASENQDQLSYDQLINASKDVKTGLQDFIENEKTNVGVLLHHSVEIVPVILGILDSYAPFCCLNPNQSSTELMEMVCLLQCSIGIAEKQFSLKNYKEHQVLKEFKLFNKHLVVLKLTDQNPMRQNKSSSQDIEEKDVFELSKTMFCCSTSGTTGKPKMVQVPFKCLMPNVSSLSKHYNIDRTDVIYISSSPTFDPFVMDIFLALFNGATILMMTNEIRLSTSLLLRSFERNSMTIMQITPSLFRRFSKEDIRNRLLSTSSSLRCLILGGEQFPPTDEVSSWFEVDGEIKMHTRLFNIYGITEVSCWSTIYEVSLIDLTSKNVIPIGLPLDQYTSLKVVDCITKEIIHSGIGELLIESKIRKCIIRENGSQVNKDLETVPTGDMVEIKTEEIYYKTRMNNMVKIFGRKVNLTNIESITKSCWAIAEACCVYHKDTNTLNLFIQFENGREYTKKEILWGLRQKLVEEEIPHEIYFVSEFPLSCHGKISKSKLLESIEKPINCNLQEFFIAKLEENLPNFNVETTLKLSFLAAGGSSSLALQLVNEFEQKFNVNDAELITMFLNIDISIEQVFLHLRDNTTKSSTANPLKLSTVMPCTWSHDMKKCIDAPPTICKVDDKSIVSVGSHSHLLINVDTVSGQLLSRLTLPDRIECQVVQYKNYGIVGCYDGFVYCFDILNGTEIWKFNSGGVVKSRGYIVGDIFVFGNYNPECNLWCLRIEDGSLIWNQKIGSKSIYSGIIGVDTKLLVTTLDGFCVAIEPLTGKSLWEVRLQSPIFSTPKLLGDMIFVAEVLGFVHCINSKGYILWSYKANGNIYSSIESIGKNVICFGCYNKSVYCISVNTGLTSSYELLWKVETSGQIFAAPRHFIFNSANLLLICSTNGFICVLDENGKILKVTRIDGEIFSTPSVIESKVIIASRNNLLYCFEIDKILSSD